MCGGMGVKQELTSYLNQSSMVGWKPGESRMKISNRKIVDYLAIGQTL